MNRRQFLSDSSKAGMAGTLIFAGTKATDMEMKNIFVHHVYFFLNNPDSAEDQAALLKGLKKLATVPGIQNFHIGVKADTHREVIERGYALSWLAIFANPDDQAGYQTDPIHLEFIDECQHLWKKVIVYDSIDA